MTDQVFPASLDAVVAAPPSSQSGASWPAILGGAFVAVSASLILMALGSGVGFASFSVWSDAGAAAKALTVNAAIWLIVIQWLSAALGGYITGRLRTRWPGTHHHEVFFRDTAHGLITWSVATVFVAAVLTSSLWSAISAGVHATASGAASAAGAMPAAGAETYETDMLFRPRPGAQASPEAVPRAELQHILANAAMTGHFPDADRAYLTDLVATRTGILPAEAQKRVDAFIANAETSEAAVRAAAETARKDAAEAALYVALSLLIGAFIASVSAALGGRLRDLHP
jgi:hypothetical protein